MKRKLIAAAVTLGALLLGTGTATALPPPRGCCDVLPPPPAHSFTVHGTGERDHVRPFVTGPGWLATYSYRCTRSGSFTLSDNRDYWSKVLVDSAGVEGFGEVQETTRGRHLLAVAAPGDCTWIVTVVYP